MSQIETEIKWEINETEWKNTQKKLTENNFIFSGKEKLTDIFFNIKKSPIVGYDFIRIRFIENEKIIFTKKKWILKNNEPTRIEEEIEISKEDALSFSTKNKKNATIKKTRSNWTGMLETYKCTVSVDEIFINNQKKYFLEAEIISNADNNFSSKNIREKIQNWFQNTLELNNRKESPSMLEIINFKQD